MRNWFSITPEKILEELKTSIKSGLTSEEAEKRLEDYGENALEEPQRASLLKRFLNQMKDPMIIVLLVAAILSLVASGFTDWADSIIILLIVIINAVISISQESNV